MSALGKITESIWFWRAIGGFGCLVFLVWAGFALALLLDTAFTGSAEWFIWAEGEKASKVEYVIAYGFNVLLGTGGFIAMVKWVLPLLKKPKSDNPTV